MPAAAPGGAGAPSLTIVSNGHGEDVIGAAVARELALLAPGLGIRAFPLVDDGSSYHALGVERLGPCRVMPSGGFTMHSLAYLLADLRAGFASMTVRQIAGLARLRSDVLLIVGDIYAQALAAPSHARVRAVLQPLVSAHHLSGGGAPSPNRFFMERISYPERALMRRLADVVYARDEATASWLRARGVTRALSLGNPMVDRADGTPLTELPPGPAVALLPGTRSYATLALDRMAEAMMRLSGVTGLVAWSGGRLPDLAGWREDVVEPRPAGLTRALRRGESRLWLLEGRFADVLASAQLAVGTAGTANEQAAAVALPVVSFALPPHYTAAFLANQRRLLGEALIVTAGGAGAIAATVRGLLEDAELRARCGRAGAARMGAAGGSRRIAEDLLRRAGLLPAATGRPAGAATP